MFKNHRKQQLLEKARKFFLDWIEIEADPKLEIAEQNIMCVQARSIELERIRLQGGLSQYLAEYDGDLINELKELEKSAVDVMRKTEVLIVRMVFSVLLLIVTSLGIFLIPARLLSITSLCSLPEDWRSDLNERVKRLNKAERSLWFIRFKKAQIYLECVWASLQIKYDNLWRSQNENNQRK